jgi:hypothetical protein
VEDLKEKGLKQKGLSSDQACSFAGHNRILLQFLGAKGQCRACGTCCLLFGERAEGLGRLRMLNNRRCQMEQLISGCRFYLGIMEMRKEKSLQVT